MCFFSFKEMDVNQTPFNQLNYGWFQKNKHKKNSVAEFILNILL